MIEAPRESAEETRERYRALGLVYYTPAEERLNTWSHVAGVAAAMVLLVCMLLRATTPTSIVTAVLSALLWGVQFGLSAAYHGARDLKRKAFLRRLDYPAVSLNVVACGAAFSLLYGSLYGYVALGVSLLIVAVVLGLCLADFARYRPLGVVAAFVVGALMFGSFLSAYLSPEGIYHKYPVVWLHLAGLLCSLLGAAIFGVKRPYVHGVFHLFVLVGPVLCAVGNLYQLH